MGYIKILLIVLLSIAAQWKVNNAYAETKIMQNLARCAVIDNNQKRLACYDQIAHRNPIRSSHEVKHKYIKPPISFLDTKLVSEPWKDEYTLTVESFVELISRAVMEDKTPVTVQGWSRDKGGYILHITMKTPVELHFLPRKSSGKAMAMSLLQDVKMDGYTLGADQFIMSIAAMVPDKKEE